MQLKKEIYEIAEIAACDILLNREFRKWESYLKRRAKIKLDRGIQVNPNSNINPPSGLVESSTGL